MRHRCRVNKLGKPADQRRALRALTTELIGMVGLPPLKCEPRRFALRRKDDYLSQKWLLAARRQALGYV